MKKKKVASEKQLYQNICSILVAITHRGDGGQSPERQAPSEEPFRNEVRSAREANDAAQAPGQRQDDYRLEHVLMKYHR
jgi:hypothetical protein